MSALGTGAAGAIDVAEFRFISELVHDRSAIVLEPGKEYLAEARLMPLARREGLSNVGDLVARLKRDKDSPLHRRVVEAMTTNETSFFRDQAPFAALRDVVLPALIEKRRQRRRLRIWSAAASTGQEAYSIAMVLAESFARELAGWDIRIVGTDLNAEVLERAREGSYSQLEVNRGLPAAMLVKYFERVGMSWRIGPALRERVEFRALNLAERWPASLDLFDVIFMRNVLIYFDIPTKRTILGQVRRTLTPDGVLFLGAAETTLQLDDHFERIKVERAGCYAVRP